MTGGMFSRTYYTKLNFDFPYVRSLSLRRAPFIEYSDESTTLTLGDKNEKNMPTVNFIPNTF